MELAFQWGRLANMQIMHITKAENNECYEKKEADQGDRECLGVSLDRAVEDRPEETIK